MKFHTVFTLVAFAVGVHASQNICSCIYGENGSEQSLAASKKCCEAVDSYWNIPVCSGVRDDRIMKFMSECNVIGGYAVCSHPD